MSAPERIWADTDGGWMPHDCSEMRRDPCTEYIRADLVQALVDALRYYGEGTGDIGEYARAALSAIGEGGE